MSFGSTRQKQRRGGKRPSPAAHIRKSYKAAMKLDRVGMDLTVLLDNGQEMHTKLVALPWTLGHGAWVATVEGIRGGYDCARMRPAERQVAA